MATSTRQLYVHGYSCTKNLWYCVDIEKLKCISDVLSPVAQMESEFGGGWALVDGHIYWAGGLAESLLDRVGHSMKLYRHNIRSAQPEFWECVSHSKELQQYEPCALALGRTIYFLGGTNLPHIGDNYEGRHCGEAYNIDTKSWKLVALNVQDFAPIFSGRTTAVMKEESDATVVCCSFPAGNLLFYKLNLDRFKFEVHPNFNFSTSLPNSFVVYEGDLEMLAYAINTAPPLVSNSTLYWLTNDLHYLYGYDFSKQKWFRSTSLKHDLFRSTSWESAWERVPVPVLVELSSTSFLVIALLSRGKLGVASLSVCKTTDTLYVSVGEHQTLHVDPDFLPLDGMVAM